MRLVLIPYSATCAAILGSPVPALAGEVILPPDGAAETSTEGAVASSSSRDGAESESKGDEVINEARRIKGKKVKKKVPPLDTGAVYLYDDDGGDKPQSETQSVTLGGEQVKLIDDPTVEAVQRIDDPVDDGSVGAASKMMDTELFTNLIQEFQGKSVTEEELRTAASQFFNMLQTATSQSPVANPQISTEDVDDVSDDRHVMFHQADKDLYEEKEKAQTHLKKHRNKRKREINKIKDKKQINK